jgi:hypothetical protein
MSFPEPSSAQQALESTPQNRHRVAAELHEKAVKHHRHAAELHEAGEPTMALTHGNIARKHASCAFALWDAVPET